MSDEIEQLPSIARGPCKDCGSLEWESCNLDLETNEFKECNKCHYWDEIEQVKKRRLQS